MTDHPLYRLDIDGSVTPVFEITDEMAERLARSLYEQGFGYDIDADETAKQSMLTVSRAALAAALHWQLPQQEDR